MKTELIAAWKLIKRKDGVEMYIVTTESGATVWCTKSQFDSNSETITYQFQVKGTKYLDKNKVEAITTEDRNEFLGCGKQIIKKFNTLEVMDHLANKGITPTFSMS